jgi:hypothetical protein
MLSMSPARLLSDAAVKKLAGSSIAELTFLPVDRQALLRLCRGKYDRLTPRRVKALNHKVFPKSRSRTSGRSITRFVRGWDEYR